MDAQVKAAREYHDLITKLTSENPTAKRSDLLRVTDNVARFAALSSKMKEAFEADKLCVANAYALVVCPNVDFEGLALTESPAEFIPKLFTAGKKRK